MQITGEKGIGKRLKAFLQICFYVGIVLLILLPFLLNKMGFDLKSCMFVLYPNGVILLIMTHKCIEFFNSLEQNKPFCDENVKLFKTTAIASFTSSVLWFIDFLYEITFMKSTDTVFYSILIFLCVLFFGFSIALLILSELFRQATEYKKENDLTI